MAEAAGSLDPTASPSPIHHRWWGLALKVLAALVVVGLGAWLWYVAIEPQEARLEQLLSELGPWGPVLFVGIFVVATGLFFPESVLAIASGAIFGLFWGLVWTVVAGMITVATVFLLGRHFLGGPARRLLLRHPRVAAIEKAAESRGLRLVFLLRLAPLNFSILNWMLAVSDMRLRAVLLSSLGMIPGNLSTVYVGYAARHTADLAARAKAGAPDGIVAGDSILHEVALYAGLGASLLVSVLVTRIAVKALKQSTSTDATPAPSAAG